MTTRHLMQRTRVLQLRTALSTLEAHGFTSTAADLRKLLEREELLLLELELGAA